MKKVIILILILSFPVKAKILLARRKPDIDYTVYFKKALEDSRIPVAGTPLSTARPYRESNLREVTDWGSYENVLGRFSYARDLRFIKWKTMMRRSSWLYPDDGCFARAGLIVKNMHGFRIPVPEKIFVFGNLKVTTANSPRGYVTWWYHVAPVVEVLGQKYVLDPAVEPTRPLTLHEWLSRMGNPSTFKVAICSSGTYGPGSNCGKPTDGRETSARSAQGKYLELEWNRLLSLGRKPEIELGSSPPWSSEGGHLRSQ